VGLDGQHAREPTRAVDLPVLKLVLRQKDRAAAIEVPAQPDATEPVSTLQGGGVEINRLGTRGDELSPSVRTGTLGRSNMGGRENQEDYAGIRVNGSILRICLG